MMQQQVNLYLPEFHTQKDPVTVLLIGQAIAGVISLLPPLTCCYGGFRCGAGTACTVGANDQLCEHTLLPIQTIQGTSD